MTKKSRIVINFSMSMLERTEAGKLIQAYEKEYIKPYRHVGIIRQTAGYLFLSAALFTLCMMLVQIFNAPHDNSVMARSRVINTILLSLFGLSLALFYLQDMLQNRIMNKNKGAEMTDNETAQRVKITRYFVENITNSATVRVYWEHVKASYRKGGFIFIHMRNDNCIVIPERALATGHEASVVADFIQVQIAQRKQQAGV